MKRTITALIALLFLTGVTVNGTAALLGGTFIAGTGTAITEAFGVTVTEAPTADQLLQAGASTIPLTWRIHNDGTLPADVGVRFDAPADAQGFAVARTEVEASVTITSETYLSPTVASYTGPLGEVADRMLVASKDIPGGVTWRIDITYRLPDDSDPALSNGISLPWALEITARQTADGQSDFRSNTGPVSPTLGWLH